MANKRMFSLQIVDTDAFLDMPSSSQLLYFHLSMRADDDGFVGNPKKIMRLAGLNDDDLKILIAKRFILTFESGVIVIKHWRINNYIQKDRYSETKYTDEKKLLTEKENGSYTECIQPVSIMDTQYRVGLGESRLDEISLELEDTPAKKSEKFFTDEQEFNRILNELTENGMQKNTAFTELKKFKSYWTEPNKSGTKQRWELEKTFEIGRRLAKWFNNFPQFNQSQKTNATII